MIVKLHDGTEGELVGWAHQIVRHGRSGGVVWRPEIVVLREDSIRDVMATLWAGIEWHTPKDAQLDLTRAVALAGLCFWPDPDGRDLDLSPWVRDRLRSAFADGQMAHRIPWDGPTTDVKPIRASLVKAPTRKTLVRATRVTGRCIACRHFNPKAVGDHWSDDHGSCDLRNGNSVMATFSCSSFELCCSQTLREIHDQGYPGA